MCIYRQSLLGKKSSFSYKETGIQDEKRIQLERDMVRKKRLISYALYFEMIYKRFSAMLPIASYCQQRHHAHFRKKDLPRLAAQRTPFHFYSPTFRFFLEDSFVLEIIIIVYAQCTSLCIS